MWKDLVKMIVKCSKCQGKMRVDQSRIPVGEKFKIRCPTCGEIQPFTGQPADSVSSDQQEVMLKDVAIPRKPATPDQSEKAEPQRSPDEFTIPSDAFQSFRFPGERTAGSASRNKSSGNPGPRKGIRVLIFALVSLAIIAAFALIVNVVLPGSGGQKPAVGLPQWEENSHQKAPVSR